MSADKIKTANWEAGTLDKTRRNIGEIDAEEAKRMAKLLGGEVMYEKDAVPKKVEHKRRGSLVRDNPYAKSTKHSNKSKATEAAPVSPPTRAGFTFKPISKKIEKLYDSLMLDSDYKIKKNFGLFNFMRKINGAMRQKINPTFYSTVMKMQLEALKKFESQINDLQIMAPAQYKVNIEQGTETKFKFLRLIRTWQLANIRNLYFSLASYKDVLTLSDLIPYTKAVYRTLLPLYYYGEVHIIDLIKEIYQDELKYPDALKQRLTKAQKEAIVSYQELQSLVIKRLYPILMRASTASFYSYPDFFHKESVAILKFLGLEKFDLLLFDKRKLVQEEKDKVDSIDGSAVKGAGNKEEEKEEKEDKEKEASDKKEGNKSEEGGDYVSIGFNLLDRMFPQAGFLTLDKCPDMYPYFDPLYNFGDGFNMLSPQNPLQVTIVFMRIIEDFFQGCRRIDFTATTGTSEEESFSKVIDDWINYRIEVFGKLYKESLTELVNNCYSQEEFEKTQFGKKLRTTLYWFTAYNFLPLYKVDRLILEKPINTSTYPPLFRRVSFLKRYLSKIVEEAAAVKETQGVVSEVNNLWAKYNFGLTNEVSKRLDVFTNAKNKDSKEATNYSLLYYTFCIISAFDYWLNSNNSPAYSYPNTALYRISSEDGKPLFTVPKRADQNKLFVERVKKDYQEGKK